MWVIPSSIASCRTDGCAAVGGRAEDAGTGQLHGAVPDLSDRQVPCQRERPAGKCIRLPCVSLVSLSYVDRPAAGAVEPRRCQRVLTPLFGTRGEAGRALTILGVTGTGWPPFTPVGWPT